VGFTGNRAREQCLTSSRRSNEQHALRNSAAELLELFRVAQKFDQLLDFILRFLDAGHVLKRDLVLVAREHTRLGFAEIQRAFAGHPDLLAEKDIEYQQEERDREETDQRLRHQVGVGANGGGDAGLAKFFLEIGGEIQRDSSAKWNLLGLVWADGLLDVSPAQGLRRLTFLVN